MTHQNDCTLPSELLEQVAEKGLDYLPELIRIMINTAMQAERQKYLGVSPYVKVRPHSSLGYKPPAPIANVVQSSQIDQVGLTL